MTFYHFADISHFQGAVDVQVFARAGYSLAIIKASDNYHMPDANGRYDFAAQRHTDAYFTGNFVRTRAASLVAGAYHFCRFDRPLPLSRRTAIVQANLENFQNAVGQLPAEHRASIHTAILDMEQSAVQLHLAGLTPVIVSGMAKDLVTLFLEHYARVILYSGSWWTDQWLTSETTEWMAERVGVWEPEYVSINGNRPGNPAYQPSVPAGFSNQYALSAADYLGKLFAWQFTNKARFTGMDGAIDLNQTRLPKEELFRLFHQPAGDWPSPEPSGAGEAQGELLGAVAALDANLVELQQMLARQQRLAEETLALTREVQTRLQVRKQQPGHVG